jgi:hypothetical protein
MKTVMVVLRLVSVPLMVVVTMKVMVKWVGTLLNNSLSHKVKILTIREKNKKNSHL